MNQLQRNGLPVNVQVSQARRRTGAARSRDPIEFIFNLPNWAIATCKAVGMCIVLFGGSVELQFD